MASPTPLFAVKLWNRRPTSDELLADMRRVARANDGALTFDLYGRHGNHSTNTIAHRFGSWGAALQAAGLPRNIDRGLSETQLFENLAEVWRKLGRQPIGRDLVKCQGVSRYSSAAYEARFGSWNKALLAFAASLEGPRREHKPERPKASAEPERPPRPSRKINWRLRATVLIRDNCICRMCGASPAKDPAVTLHVDHIEPWSKGGATALDNLQTLCSACNIGKSDRLCAKRKPKRSRSCTGRQRRSRSRRKP
jgi:hypothetical protein